jgi:HlyD family secretion protein
MSRTIISFAAVFVFMAIGFFLVTFIKESQIKLQPKPTASLKPIPVSAWEAGPVTIPEVTESRGVIEAYRKAKIGTEVSGIVKYVSPKAEMGSSVPEGDILVVIDTKLIELDKKRLEVALESANLAVKTSELEVKRLANTLENVRNSYSVADTLYKRSVELYQKGTISRNELDIAEQQFIAAQTALNAAEDAVVIATSNKDRAVNEVVSLNTQIEKLSETISRATIKCPFPAVVVSRNVEAGENVNVSSILLQIVRLDKVYFTTNVPAEDILRIEKGDEASVEILDFDMKFAGTVENTGVEADPRTRSYLVQILLDNPQQILRTGLFGIARIKMPQRKYELAIPTAAIMGDAGRPYVYVTKDGIATMRYIQTGRIRLGYAEVLKGLTQGEVVAVTMLDKLTNGIAVKPTLDYTVSSSMADIR